MELGPTGVAELPSESSVGSSLEGEGAVSVPSVPSGSVILVPVPSVPPGATSVPSTPSVPSGVSKFTISNHCVDKISNSYPNRQ